MDLRFPGLLAFSGFAMTGGCSPDDKNQQASLEERTAQFEQKPDTIKDQPLKDAVADLGGSLLLLERARLKLQQKPIENRIRRRYP